MSTMMQALDTVQAYLPSHEHIANLADDKKIDGDNFATELKDFFAPIAAVLIGIIGLKFLFGEQKSLAGFIGFLVLAVAVYALIMWGEDILGWLGSTMKDWLNPQ